MTAVSCMWALATAFVWLAISVICVAMHTVRNNSLSVAKPLIFFINNSQRKIKVTAVSRMWALARAFVWLVMSAICVAIHTVRNNSPSVAKPLIFFINLSQRKIIVTAVSRMWALATAFVWLAMSAICVAMHTVRNNSPSVAKPLIFFINNSQRKIIVTAVSPMWALATAFVWLAMSAICVAMHTVRNNSPSVAKPLIFFINNSQRKIIVTAVSRMWALATAFVWLAISVICVTMHTVRNNSPSVAKPLIFFINLSQRKMIVTAVSRMWALATASVWLAMSAICVAIQLEITHRVWQSLLYSSSVSAKGR